MICPKCKKTVNNNAKFCGYCGKKFSVPTKAEPVSKPTPVVSVPVQQPVYTEPPVQDNVAKCPKCGSTSLQARKKGVSVGKAVTGALLVGPLGLVAGGIGMNKVEIVCLNCGNVFKAN